MYPFFVYFIVANFNFKVNLERQRQRQRQRDRERETERDRERGEHQIPYNIINTSVSVVPSILLYNSLANCGTIPAQLGSPIILQ